jgi:4'-phosphopantetheinyl transferase
MTSEKNTTRIRYLSIDTIDKYQFEHILNQAGNLPEREIDTTDGLVYKKHVLGRWLAFTILKTYGVAQPNFLRMAVGKFGKPHFPEGKVFFSISHSGNMIICAASDQGEIGIDLEEIRPVDVREYEDCFSPVEWKNISLVKNSDEKFFQEWTKKESLVKADGRGLQIDLKDVLIEDAYGVIRGESKKWYFCEIELKGFSCYLCTGFQSNDFDLSAQRF